MGIDNKRGVGITSIIISTIEKTFKGIVAAIKWVYPDNASVRKPESIDIWDDIDNLHGILWLGRLHRRKPGIRPVKRHEEDKEISEEKRVGGEV